MVKTQRNATVAISAGVSAIVSEAKYGTQKRIVLEIANLNAVGGNDVFVSVGTEATANTGRRCQPGQTITWAAESGYQPPQDRICAIAAGNTNISVYEEVE